MSFIKSLCFTLLVGCLLNTQSAFTEATYIDLDKDSHRQVVIDREAGQYLGHPTTVLLEDNKTMLCVYPKGHGKGGIVYKRSYDAGLTWTKRLPTPDSWATSREVPTLHRVIDAEGTKRIIMFSGLYPCRMAVTEDDGLTWSELKPIGEWGGIVNMGFVIDLKTGPGHYMAMAHDDGRFFKKGGKRANPVEFILYKTLSTDGGLTWSTPEIIQRDSKVHLCEPGVIRSPDGKQLAVLLRENSRTQNSQIIFSNDEGNTWTDPRPLPDSLNGDRHTGKYTSDGRLFISFRSNSPKGKKAKSEGDWAAWVGTYDDLANGNSGQYHVRLKDNTKGKDCAYPGVEVLPDDTIVTTTYGHWTKDETPYILSVRLKLSELDEKAKLAAKPLKIVAFGDSTTAYRNTIKEVYSDRLPKLLKEEGISSSVINSGIGGSHTGSMKDNKRFQIQHASDRFETAVRAHNPDIVIIQFGWNDSWIDSQKEGDPSRIGVQAYEKNLRHFIETLKNDGATPLLMTPNQARAGGLKSWQFDRTEEYVKVVRNLSEEYNVPLIDVWNVYGSYSEHTGGDVNELLLDLLHPNDAGHQLVAEYLQGAISKLGS